MRLVLIALCTTPLWGATITSSTLTATEIRYCPFYCLEPSTRNGDTWVAPDGQHSLDVSYFVNPVSNGTLSLGVPVAFFVNIGETAHGPISGSGASYNGDFLLTILAIGNVTVLGGTGLGTVPNWHSFGAIFCDGSDYLGSCASTINIQSTFIFGEPIPYTITASVRRPARTLNLSDPSGSSTHAAFAQPFAQYAKDANGNSIPITLFYTNTPEPSTFWLSVVGSICLVIYRIGRLTVPKNLQKRTGPRP